MVISIDSQSKGLILIFNNKSKASNPLSRYLIEAGYQVLVCPEAETGTNDAVYPDLILLDIPETELNQFDLAPYLKYSAARKEQPPIILMVESLETIEQTENLQLNIVDYLLKPTSQEVLIARIEQNLKLKYLQQSLTRQEKEAKIIFKLAENTRQSLNLEVILQTVTVDIQELLNCDRVIISSYTPHYTFFVAQALGMAISPIIPENYSNFLAETSARNTTDYEQYQQGNIQVIEDLKNHQLKSSEKEYLRELGITAQLVIPICLPNKNLESQIVDHSKITTLDHVLVSPIPDSLWGWLVIHECDVPKIWQQQEIQSLQNIVTQTAIAIKQALLQEQLQQQSQQLQQLALYDPPTQVYNRRYLDQQIELEWRRLRRISSPISIIICDVDYFDAYQDIYGRQAAKQCLQKIAQIISQTIRRPADFVSLFGEDKFAIVLPHTPVQGAKKIAQAIQKMIKQLQLPHVKSAINPFITLSFGIASTTPNAIESPSLMMQAAEQALYLAKSRGRNCFAVYNQEISQLRLDHKQELTWNKRLHRALEKNLFRLYAQSIEPLNTKDTRQHFEILLRLQEQDNNIIMPNDFLPIANYFSMMPQIDSWVIENLFAQLAEANFNNYEQYVFTINLSGASLNNDIFLDFLQAKILEYHLEPQLFCFEITESVAINNIPKISSFIKSLKDLGCSFALDDFGTGMSSLTYLKELPVDYIKIDGSFIREINQDSVTKSMVIAINNLAQIIGLKTIAEFVEDQAILTTIQELKIDYAQGFYFSRPCLLSDIIA